MDMSTALVTGKRTVGVREEKEMEEEERRRSRGKMDSNPSHVIHLHVFPKINK